MTENQMPEQNEVTLNAVPDALAEVPAEKLAALKALVQQFSEGAGTTASGSEATDETPVAKSDGKGTFTGADVDWSEYDLDYNLAHLYPRAKFVETPEGPKWAVTLDEFFTNELSLGSHGKRTQKGAALNAGEVLSDMVNSAEGWRIAAILPASIGRVGIVLQKKTTIVLPDPKQLQLGTEVAAPLDPELKDTEDAALGWMEKESLTPAPESGRVEEVTEPSLAERFVQQLNDPTRVPNLIKNALELNAGTVPAPVPAGQQPPARKVDEVALVIAAADNAADAVEEALDGPDFERTVE
jgi:hypothetical protein